MRTNFGNIKAFKQLIKKRKEKNFSIKKDSNKFLRVKNKYSNFK